jgi:GT2 family glycosyltransferase
MTPPDVAVLIVNYRSAALTLECLGSLQAERARAELAIRAVVVDNASGDAPELARAIGERGWREWVELVAAPRNGGFAYGNNRGLERVYAQRRPDYLYLINPDAQVLPGAIATLVRFLQTHPQAGIVGSSFQNADGSDWPIAFRFPTLASELIGGLQLGLVTRLLKRWEVPRTMDRTTQRVDWVSGASMMIRPEVFETIGGMDENYFLYFEETDFCRRAQAAGFETWYVPASRVMHIGGGVTQAFGHAQAPRRLPGYWFDSRRRYFALAFGTGQSMLIDVVACVASVLGLTKNALLRRRAKIVPHFTRDLVRSSILWPRNRGLPPPHCYLPERAPRRAA